MLKTCRILFKQNVGLYARDCSVRSKHSNEGLNLQVLGVEPQKSGFHQSPVQEYPAAKPLPLPTNIQDVASAEKLRFSPHRARDISGSFISSSSSPNLEGDGRIECYDCTGAVSLSSAMQTNVPFPFFSRGKPTHLNMPGGQWGQNEKYMSDDLNKAHHLNSRKNGGTCLVGLKKENEYFCKYFLRNDFVCSGYVQSRLMSTVQENKETVPVESKTVNSKENAKIPELTTKQKLKAAVKDYGIVVVVFHVGISLVSLGCCYLAVVSGVDLSKIIQQFGIEEGAATAGVVTQFVVAYAVHKALAPGRIAITLTFVPFIVKKLRNIGFLKPPKTK